MAPCKPISNIVDSMEIVACSFIIDSVVKLYHAAAKTVCVLVLILSQKHTPNPPHQWTVCSQSHTGGPVYLLQPLESFKLFYLNLRACWGVSGTKMIFCVLNLGHVQFYFILKLLNCLLVDLEVKVFVLLLFSRTPSGLVWGAAPSFSFPVSSSPSNWPSTTGGWTQRTSLRSESTRMQTRSVFFS